MQLDCLFIALLKAFHRLIYQQLMHIRFSYSPSAKPDLGLQSRFGAARLISVLSFRA
jgi:hypothetical protein